MRGKELLTNMNLILAIVGIVPNIRAVKNLPNGIQTMQLMKDVQLNEGRGICFRSRLGWMLESFVHFWSERDHSN